MTPRDTEARPQLGTIDAIAQFSFLIHTVLERQAAARGLSVTQTRLLGVLRDRRPTMHELARLLGLDKSSATGLVDRAERRGLVVRGPSAADRRSVHVTLTDDGRALVADVATAFEAEVAQRLRPLSESERRTLDGLLSRVLVVDAAEHGVDLFEALDPAAPSAGG
jgi:DNA-binding MarR family transcriptional regulator